MKIQPAHYATLAAALDAIKTQLDTARVEYAARGLSDMRYRWDAFRAARVGGNSTQWLCSTLYPYLNDTHIDTALRHYFGHKQ